MFARDDDLDNVRDDPRFAAIQREARDLALPGYNSWFLGSSRNRSQWREAARKFEEYARAHPQKGRAWFNLGFASLAGERPEAAAEAFQKALELNYRKPTTMYNLACCYARLDQKDAAFDWLFKALDAGFDATGTLRGRRGPGQPARRPPFPEGPDHRQGPRKIRRRLATRPNQGLSRRPTSREAFMRLLDLGPSETLDLRRRNLLRLRA